MIPQAFPVPWLSVWGEHSASGMWEPGGQQAQALCLGPYRQTFLLLSICVHAGKLGSPCLSGLDPHTVMEVRPESRCLLALSDTLVLSSEHSLAGLGRESLLFYF